MRMVVALCALSLVCVAQVQGGVSFDDYVLLNTITRGDVNGDGALNITDPVALQEYLFQGTYIAPCEKACDSNDDGSVNLSDSVYLLNFLFKGGDPPPEPGGAECGFDPTEDDLGCETNMCVSEPPGSS